MIKVLICWLIERYYTAHQTNWNDDHTGLIYNTWIVNDRRFELLYDEYHGNHAFVTLLEIQNPRPPKFRALPTHKDSSFHYIIIKFADPEMFDKIIEFCES